MTSSLTALAAPSAEHATELPFPAVVFGVLTMLAFLALLGLLWAFRGSAIRMADPEHDNVPHRH